MPKRFSLPTLLVVATCIVASVVYTLTLRDDHNTLPVAQITASGQLPIRDESEVLLVPLGPGLPLDANRTRFGFAVVNRTPYAIEYCGFTPDSWDQRPPIGKIHPLYAQDHDIAGEWIAKKIGWCATGLDTMRIPPDHACKFDVLTQGGDGKFRVGFGYSWKDERGQNHSQILWSEGMSPE